MEKEGHKYGEFENLRFDNRRADFYKYLEYLNESQIPTDEILMESTAYIGHMQLNRILTIYELYKKTLGIAGHIADVGVYKGASSLLFAKLVRIFEPEALTLVHGFDWFEGMKPTKDDPDYIVEGGYCADYQSVMRLVELQKLDDILKIHKMDLTKDCKDFFEKHSHIKFKLIMMDAGLYEVMKASLPFFWEHLAVGGIIIFDQYSHEFSPGETRAVSEFIPDAIVRTIPNSWMPNAYIIK